MNQEITRRKFGLMALGLATSGLAVATIASPAMAFKVNVPGGQDDDGAEGPEDENVEGTEDAEGDEQEGPHRRRKPKN